MYRIKVMSWLPHASGNRQHFALASVLRGVSAPFQRIYFNQEAMCEHAQRMAENVGGRGLFLTVAEWEAGRGRPRATSVVCSECARLRA